MTKLFLIATALLSAATPALAREVRPAGGADATGSANAQNPAQRYCIVDTVTGSRIPIKVCQTRAQWSAQGVDLPAKP